MADRREFLGWDRPALVSAAEWLWARSGEGDGAPDGGAIQAREGRRKRARIEAGVGADDGAAAGDLSLWTVVTPGARAGQVLLALLVDLAAARGCVLRPPTLLTPGEVLIAVFGPLGRPAGVLTRRLLWAEAVREAVAAGRAAALLPRVNAEDDIEEMRGIGPAANLPGTETGGAGGRASASAGATGPRGGRSGWGSWSAWGGYAGLLERAHAALGGAMVRFADVPERAARAGVVGAGEDEPARWAAAAEIEAAYLRRVAELGMIDDGVAGIEAVAAGDVVFRGRIALAGVVEMPTVARAALERLEAAAAQGQVASDGGARGVVSVLVPAPAEEAAGFDPWGCVREGAWEARWPGIAEADIYFEDGPAEQAERVANVLSAMGRGAGEAGADQNSSGQPRSFQAGAGGGETAGETREQEGRPRGRRAEEIVIGVADEQVAERIERLLEESAAPERGGGAQVRSGAGRPMGRAGPVRVLSAVAAWAEGQRPQAWAALVREPDVERALARMMHEMSSDQGHGAGACLTRGGETGLRARQSRDLDGDLEADQAVGLENRESGGETVEFWLAALDRSMAAGLPARIDGRWPGVGAGSAKILEMLRHRVQDLLGPWADGGEWEASPAEAGEAALDVLRRVYADVQIRTEIESGRRLMAGLRTVRAAVDEIAELRPRRAADSPESLDRRGAGAGWRASDVLRCIVERAEQERLPEEADGSAIEMLGWLDAALDPAAVMILPGFNEGMAPEAVVVDLLLPEGLRAGLGVWTGASRAARDAFWLSHAARARERVVVVAGRRSASGEPLRPSRLLFGGDEIAASRRLGRWAGVKLEADLAAEPSGGDDRVRVIGPAKGGARWGARDAFPVRPMASGAAAPEAMPVTGFAEYLASPYGFYVRHVLILNEVTRVGAEPAAELGPAEFGTLVHAAAARFGGDQRLRSLRNAGAIARALDDCLDAAGSALLGDRPRAAVGLQVELARVRLRRLAEVEAARRAQGWEILHVEWAPRAEHAGFQHEEVSMPLTGRIDRIELHPDSRRLALLDLKTADGGDGPEKDHRRSARGGGTSAGEGGKASVWRSLQLPMYRRLVAHLAMENGWHVGPLGYLTLAKDQTLVQEAHWTEADLASADRAAAVVIRGVLDGEFAEIGRPTLGEGSLAALCGVGLIDSSRGQI